VGVHALHVAADGLGALGMAPSIQAPICTGGRAQVAGEAEGISMADAHLARAHAPVQVGVVGDRRAAR
jgi:hypothetical protein